MTSQQTVLERSRPGERQPLGGLGGGSSEVGILARFFFASFKKQPSAGHVSFSIERQRMKENRTPNYGVDAPVAVRNMLIVAALGIISLIARLLGVWSRQDAIAVIARPLMMAGLSCGAMALWMIYDSKIGKIRERDTYLDKIDWNGHERVLDVGCGLGLFLIAAAKRLSTGRAVGIDKWQQEDLSGNNAAGTLRNAMIEGVADKVEVRTGDARKLPFADASFDVVLSSSALHNIYNAGERQTALREIARVLAPGGRVLIVDVRHISKYAATLRDAGLTDARCVQGVFSYLLTLITFGSVQWGYVIGSRVIGRKS
jgi:ubiquinone/menaquinone biosynthesis C-methylase UbiE